MTLEEITKELRKQVEIALLQRRDTIDFMGLEIHVQVIAHSDVDLIPELATALYVTQ